METQSRIVEMRQKLRDSGHRITPQRLCILEALLAANSHPSAEEIYAQVRLISPTTSLATVYKTLDTLRDIGEVMEMEVGDGPTRSARAAAKSRTLSFPVLLACQIGPGKLRDTKSTPIVSNFTASAWPVINRKK
jgi:Fe2+ or Zn2+ uptake regulation protein